jgi:hypothetical protein
VAGRLNWVKRSINRRQYDSVVCWHVAATSGYDPGGTRNVALIMQGVAFTGAATVRLFFRTRPKAPTLPCKNLCGL